MKASEVIGKWAALVRAAKTPGLDAVNVKRLNDEADALAVNFVQQATAHDWYDLFEYTVNPQQNNVLN